MLNDRQQIYLAIYVAVIQTVYARGNISHGPAVDLLPEALTRARDTYYGLTGEDPPGMP